ncbi:Vitamin K-dependent gamma-carboxylase [Mycobacterium xenopi RIVM700367]|uniref:HTTM domain-containing protein n=1 Tax=Mycobacterium xenopi TaxID=1789 RepID=UPI00025AD876|nr:HTTM domain-containing protein [Mycobacterium xenopi]EID16351.1 Vitamin K-dependent gamma-carboxylase [Mycobacterium xenopi RIVM700367]
MTEPGSRQRPWAAAANSWRAFWFQTQPAYTVGLVRMAFGAVAVGWTVSLRPDLYELFGPRGVQPRQPGGGFQWGVFALWTSDRALLLGWAVLLVSSVLVTIGWHSRLAALVVFVLIVSFEHRNPWVWNSGDIVVRLEALFLALSPCGAALSLDQKRAGATFWSAQQRPQWPVRLMQLQLSLIYLASVLSKINGSAWPQGTAVSYALRLQDMLLVRAPDWLTNSALLMNIATWGSLGVELSLAILVWNRRLRPWVLAAGVVMHTLIMITIAVGFFTLAMFVLYLAFVPPETVQRLPRNTKDAVTKTVAMLTRRPRSSRQWGSERGSDAAAEGCREGSSADPA